VITENPIRILLVEDEKRLARLIERQLIRAGYTVSLVFTAEEGLTKATSEEINLILLDINLPDKSGFEVLRELRKKSYSTPVLILTARSQIEDRIQGLENGADDYLIKPFDSGELLARIHAILRRSGVVRTSILRTADLVFDVVKRTVRRSDKELDLTQRELALLEFFLKNKNQIITRKRIAQEVWGYTFETGTNIVDVYVSYLRRAIDDGFEPKLIQTVYGQGFILKDS
jgi:DNA-binding response OmpR family regulator